MGMVNGLNRMDDTRPFSPTAFTLAVKLIDLFNRLQWADSVAVDLERMRLMAKCTSRHTAIRARDELIERGVLIVVVKGKKGSPSAYGMADLQFGASSAPNPAPNPALNPAPNPAPIYIKDYKRQDETRQESSAAGFISPDDAAAAVEDQRLVLDAAEQAGFPANAATYDRIVALVAEYGAQWVTAAIARCVEQGSSKIAYLDAVLRGFRSDGGPGQPKKTAAAPSWMDELRRQGIGGV